MKIIRQVEAIVNDLESWKFGLRLSEETESITGEVMTLKKRDIKLKYFKKMLHLLKGEEYKIFKDNQDLPLSDYEVEGFEEIRCHINARKKIFQLL